MSRLKSALSVKKLPKNQEIVTYSCNIKDNLKESKDFLTIFEHNLRQMSILETGDIVEFNRGLYTHSAIFGNKIFNHKKIFT